MAKFMTSVDGPIIPDVGSEMDAAQRRLQLVLDASGRAEQQAEADDLRGVVARLAIGG